MKPPALISLHDLYYLAVAALIVMVERLPRPLLREGAARCAGLAAYALSTQKRRRIEANLSRWLPASAGAAERRRIVRGVFVETWREFFSWAQAGDAGPQVEVRGLEHVRRALAAGRGAILWESNGFGQRLLATKILHANGIAYHQMHGPRNVGGFLLRRPASRFALAVVRPFFDRREERVAAGLIYLPHSQSLSFARDMHAVLERNGVICVSADGHVGRRFVTVDLLGEPKAFATGAINLSRLSGAPLLPLFCCRQSGGRTVLTVEPPLQVAAGPATEATLANVAGQYAQLLGDYVRRHPEQYRNWHLLEAVLPDVEAGSEPESAREATWTTV